MLKQYLIIFIIVFSAKLLCAQFWIQPGHGSTIDEALSIATDAAGNTYSTGYFTSSISFDGMSVVSSGVADIFIVKTNSSGVIQWLKHAGGINIDKGLDIDADSIGNSIVTGFFYGTSTFDSQSLVSAGQQDVFLAKYDSSGNLLWAKRAGGAGNDVANSVKFDYSGNVLVTGEFSGNNCQFDGIFLSSLNNSLDVFVAKYDPSGNILWAKSGSGLYTDRGTDIACDRSGNVYAAGVFSDTITFDSIHCNVMQNALFIIQYDSSGNEKWFRWMGSGNTVGMAGLAIDHHDDLVAAGNYTGSLLFYGLSSFLTLSNQYQNNYFLAKFNSQGDLIWSSTKGSDNLLEAEDISIAPDNEITIAGNFKCRLNDFSDFYGQGLFCSDGYTDCFVSRHSENGTWNWSRNFGGIKNDYLYGIATDSAGLVCVAGAFNFNLFIPANPNNFIGYTNLSVTINSPHCNDNFYGYYAALNTSGNSDIFIGKCIDLSRQPMDFFRRDAAVCNTDFPLFCIQENCPDTISACVQDTLNFITYTTLDPPLNPGPVFNYLWNTGSVHDSIITSTSGIYYATATTEDGCFTDIDSTYLILHPNPTAPTITDSKGININAHHTTPIYLCMPDSVDLTGNALPGDSVRWSGNLPGINPITVNHAGGYSFIVSNQFGCQNSDIIFVFTLVPLPAVLPRIVCLNDTDRNDTITLCDGENFSMFLYDTLTHPYPFDSSIVCMPGFSNAFWSVLPYDSISYSAETYCSDNSTNQFTPHHRQAWYYIQAWIHRNACDTDSFLLSDSLFVIVNPMPTGNLPLSITGPNQLCPGDSVMLVASGSPGISWSNGISSDTIYVSQPGNYFARVSAILTNSFGCSNVIGDTVSISITSPPQPLVSTIPANAVICPNDSVLLLCSGSGNFLWQGPNGTNSSVNSSVFVTTPGNYYCIQTDPSGCELVSNTVNIVQYNTPIIISSAGNTVCVGQYDTLTVFTNAGSTIQWQPPLNGTGTTQVVNNSGTYSCIVTSCGILTPVSLTVQFLQPAVAISTPDSVVFCVGDSIRLLGNPFMIDYLWSPGGDTSQNIIVTAQGMYTLLVHDNLGCAAKDSVLITEVEDCDSILIPNVITPNGDGHNDFFPGPHEGYLFDIKIYNRWGLLVYESLNELKGWNGTSTNGDRLSDGTYFYILTVTHTGFYTHKYHGHVMLLRN